MGKNEVSKGTWAEPLGVLKGLRDLEADLRAVKDAGSWKFYMTTIVKMRDFLKCNLPSRYLAQDSNFYNPANTSTVNRLASKLEAGLQKLQREIELGKVEILSKPTSIDELRRGRFELLRSADPKSAPRLLKSFENGSIYSPDFLYSNKLYKFRHEVFLVPKFSAVTDSSQLETGELIQRAATQRLAYKLHPDEGRILESAIAANRKAVLILPPDRSSIHFISTEEIQTLDLNGTQRSVLKFLLDKMKSQGLAYRPLQSEVRQTLNAEYPTLQKAVTGAGTSKIGLQLTSEKVLMFEGDRVWPNHQLYFWYELDPAGNLIKIL